MSSDFKWVAYFRRDVLASPNVRRVEATRSKIPPGKSGNRKGAVAPQPPIFLNPSVLSYKYV
jgi:hypothetical protein